MTSYVNPLYLGHGETQLVGVEREQERYATATVYLLELLKRIYGWTRWKRISLRRGWGWGFAEKISGGAGSEDGEMGGGY